MIPPAVYFFTFLPDDFRPEYAVYRTTQNGCPMASDLERAREIFLHVVGRVPPDGWEAYAAEACGGDAGLAERVRHLLRRALAAHHAGEKDAATTQDSRTHHA